MPAIKAGATIFKLSGPLTLPNMFAIQSDLKAATAAVVLLDLSGVPYMDSAGLGVVLNYHVSTARNGRRLIVVGVNARVQALIELTKVHKVLTLAETIEAAEAIA